EVIAPLLESQVRWPRTYVTSLDADNDGAHGGGRLDPFLTARADEAVRGERLGVGLVERVGAGGREHGDVVGPREGGQSGEVRQDGVGTGDVQGASRLQEIALGIDVNEDAALRGHGGVISEEFRFIRVVSPFEAALTRSERDLYSRPSHPTAIGGSA